MILQESSDNIKLPRPHEYVFMTKDTERSWMERSDLFLDPFTLPADKGSLQFSMSKVSPLWFYI